MTSQELIRLCLLEDREGQRLLYEHFAARMARLCQRYLRNTEDVQDALIEGFAKVFDALSRFEYTNEDSLEVWIRRIMINQCLMRLRKTRSIALEDYGFEDMAVTRNDGVDLSATDILNLVQTLPEGYRTVFNLFAIDGHSHKEIAGLLAISESASRSQLTHARNRLKDLLKVHGWK